MGPAKISRVNEICLNLVSFEQSLWGSSEIELIQVMRLGSVRTSKYPSRRPTMVKVVQVLESILEIGFGLWFGNKPYE